MEPSLAFLALFSLTQVYLRDNVAAAKDGQVLTLDPGRFYEKLVDKGEADRI
jgi:hypothetical protein